MQYNELVGLKYLIEFNRLLHLLNLFSIRLVIVGFDKKCMEI